MSRPFQFFPAKDLSSLGLLTYPAPFCRGTMKLRPLLVAFLLFAVIPQAKPHANSSALALTHVTVIDATGAPAKPNMNVVIVNGHIAAMGERVHIPEDAQIIDATGKFLIPGLWDMHVHWGDTDYLPLFLANGVTGIRIMWGSPINYEWRKQSAAGELLALTWSSPARSSTGPTLSGPVRSVCRPKRRR